ncbi:MAG: hypothetical protein ACK5CA_11330 [Cyanobacteriota bacterium]
MGKRWRRRLGSGVLTLILVLCFQGGLGAQAPIGTLTVEQVALQIYEQLPDLPKENSYRRQDNGEPDPDHTLISRLIRYHRDIQKRQTRYRFDWKLTLADYLGINEPMEPERYPGNSTLQTNPLATDTTAIRALTRQQRLALVDLLVINYHPPQPKAEPKPAPTAPPRPVTPPDPNRPVLSQPGDAQLLLP